MTYRIIWKLVDGDFYERDYKGFGNLQEAVDEWFAQYGFDLADCSEFSVKTI